MKKKRKFLKVIIAVISIVGIMAFTYVLFVFSGIPIFKYWRSIWIETAMTTADHQWLATYFIPKNIIDEVMGDQTNMGEIIGGVEFLETTAPSDIENPAIEKPEVTTQITEPNPDDILNQSSITVGKNDYAGYKVLVNDTEQGIVVSEIVGTNFKGKIMLIDDPKRVFLGITPNKDVEGLRIKDMMSYYDAVAGINASGFSDPDGNGTGGNIIGMSCNNGVYWGEYVNYYGSVILTHSDKLVVGNVSVWENYDIREGIQFGPVLIADGEKQVKGSAGYGLQPRTAIGQREDGVIVFLVIDGRNVLHSLGCTVGDMADIFEKYNAINASCCDGGSSSVLAYDGEVITKNSSANPTLGRRLPNAFLVRKK